MTKYQVSLRYSNGEEELDDEIFDDLALAVEHGDYLVSCTRQGAETLNLSNPGDYPLDDYIDPEYEIIEFDE